MDYMKTNKVVIGILVAILLILTGITIYAFKTQSPTSKLEDVTTEDINSATYNVWGDNINFTNDKYQSMDEHDPLSSGIDFSAIGDITGDGKRDAVVVTTSARADSMDELHVVIKFAGIVATKTLEIPVGEGNSVRSIRGVTIDPNRTINLTLDILGPNDPHCCASIHATHQYLFLKGALVMIK